MKQKIYEIYNGSYFNKRNTPRGFVNACSHQGSCDNDVESFLHRFTIKDYTLARNFIQNYGIENVDKMNDKTILSYVIWIIAGDIADQGSCEIDGMY